MLLRSNFVWKIHKNRRSDQRPAHSICNFKQNQKNYLQQRGRFARLAIYTKTGWRLGEVPKVEKVKRFERKRVRWAEYREARKKRWVKGNMAARSQSSAHSWISVARMHLIRWGWGVFDEVMWSKRGPLNKVMSLRCYRWDDFIDNLSIIKYCPEALNQARYLNSHEVTWILIFSMGFFLYFAWVFRICMKWLRCSE